MGQTPEKALRSRKYVFEKLSKRRQARFRDEILELREREQDAERSTLDGPGSIHTTSTGPVVAARCREEQRQIATLERQIAELAERRRQLFEKMYLLGRVRQPPLPSKQETPAPVPCNQHDNSSITRLAPSARKAVGRLIREKQVAASRASPYGEVDRGVEFEKLYSGSAKVTLPTCVHANSST